MYAYIYMHMWVHTAMWTYRHAYRYRCEYKHICKCVSNTSANVYLNTYNVCAAAYIKSDKVCMSLRISGQAMRKRIGYLSAKHPQRNLRAVWLGLHQSVEREREALSKALANVLAAGDRSPEFAPWRRHRCNMACPDVRLQHRVPLRPASSWPFAFGNGTASLRCTFLVD